MPRAAQTFYGNPCPNCGSTERYASNYSCVACSRHRMAANQVIAGGRAKRDPEGREGPKAAAERLARLEKDYAEAAAMRVPSVFHIGTPSLGTFVTGD